MNFCIDGWEPVLRVLVVGSLAYFALVVLLRASGKRTLAEMNSFDLVITVAIGASFGPILTARSIPLAEAVTAFALSSGSSCWSRACSSGPVGSGPSSPQIRRCSTTMGGSTCLRCAGRG